MSDNGYLIWMVATAAMIVAVLTIGTLAAAGLLGRGEDTAEGPVRDDEERRR